MAYNNIDEMWIIKEEDSPQQQINEQSLTQDLVKNRESLKRKLQTRRSLQQLVDVGIIPSSKTSLPFYEQRKQLQMRKTQDILKNKILSRPDRQLLIEHNILSDTIAAPAIQNTQRQLKRARLVDNLNDKLSVRPGILELVANNIFEIDSDLKQAIQGGHIQYPSLSRPLHKKTLSLSTTIPFKRSLSSIPKSKSCLTFHEYKGPSQKIEVTKVPLKPIEYNHKLSENHYGIQLRQQQLFLELIHNDKSIENLFQQSLIYNNIQSFETMKLVDLKNVCKKLNISSTGTKMKLIEKLKNAQLTLSDITLLPSQTINNESQIPLLSSSSVQLLLSTSLLNDQQLYQQQQQKLVELENQLEKFKQYDSSLSYQNQLSSIPQSIDNSTVVIPQIPPKCNPILSVQIQKRILTQQQEKLKEKLQQNTIVPLTPESVGQFLVQSQTLDDHFSSCQSTNNNVILNRLDNYMDSLSTLTLPTNDFYSNISTSSPLTHMDWMEESSPNIVDNNSDYTQFLNQFDNDHHHFLFNSTYQQQNTPSFDLFSPSSSMI